MVILLRLKYFLRRVYNLSDDKINEYNSVSTSASATDGHNWLG